jgi:hypothetical protein
MKDEAKANNNNKKRRRTDYSEWQKNVCKHVVSNTDGVISISLLTNDKENEA